MTPDEYRYSQPGPRARPFHYRWLLPALLGADRRKWVGVQWVSLAALCTLVSVYTHTWWAGVLVLGCSGVLFNLKHPVLVDLPAMALALGAAVAWNEGLWWLAVALVLIAGSVKETAPIFATIFAWHPALLVGTLSVGIVALTRAGTDAIPNGPAHDALIHPLRSSWEHHQPLPLWSYVLPWGVLLAALANPTPQLWVCVGLAYAQLIVATDSVRLYQWALPVMVLAAVPMLSGPWLPVVLVVHLVNPFRTEGV